MSDDLMPGESRITERRVKAYSGEVWVSEAPRAPGAPAAVALVVESAARPGRVVLRHGAVLALQAHLAAWLVEHPPDPGLWAWDRTRRCYVDATTWEPAGRVSP